MTIPPLVTRTKRTVYVLRERQEMSVRSLRVVQSHAWRAAFGLGHRAAALQQEKQAGQRRGHPRGWQDVPIHGVFSWYLKMARAFGLCVVHECVDAAYSELLAQHMRLCDEALECMLSSETTIQTMAYALDGSKLWSSADARLKQWKSSRRLVCNDRHARVAQRPLVPPGHVRFFCCFTDATSTVFLFQLTLACTRS